MTSTPSADDPVKLDLGFLLAAVLHVDDPRERLRHLAAVRNGVGDLEERVRRMVRATILEVRRTDPRATWADLGDLLGVSMQRAEQLSRDDYRPKGSTDDREEHAPD